MKKGELSAVVLFVLVVGILGAVLLFSGTSGPTAAGPVETTPDGVIDIQHTAEECMSDFVCKGLPGMKGEGGLVGTIGSPLKCDGANAKGECKCINDGKVKKCAEKKTCNAECEVPKDFTLKQGCDYYGVATGGRETGCWCVVTKAGADEYRPCRGTGPPNPNPPPPPPGPGPNPVSTP